MVDNESQETGSHIVLSTLRTKDYSAQLWRHDPKGYLVNKKSGQVMDVAKGKWKFAEGPKCYTEINPKLAVIQYYHFLIGIPNSVFTYLL